MPRNRQLRRSETASRTALCHSASPADRKPVPVMGTRVLAGLPALHGMGGPAHNGGTGPVHDGRESVVRRTVVAMVLAALVCVSCTSTPTTSPKSTGSSSTTTTISSTTTTSRPPSALDNLTTYFATAERVDQRLKAAAIVVNGDIGATQLTVDQSTTDAISTADPTAAGHAIPTGLTPDLLLPVMRSRATSCRASMPCGL